MLFYGSLLASYWSHDFTAWASVSRVFWEPIALFRALGLGVLPAPAMSMAAMAWKILLATSAAGVATRFSTIGAAVLGTYLLGVPHSFGKIHHDDAVLVFSMVILAFSRCGDAWSFDGLVRAARRPQDPPPSGGEYTWPIRMTWLVMSLVFFAAGVSKLRHSGLRWVTSNALAGHILRSNDALVRPAGAPWTNWGPWLAGVPWLSRTAGAVALGLELFFPLALFSRTARRILVPGVFLLQIAIALTMGPDFTQFLICYLFWVPWNGVGKTLKNVTVRRRRHSLIYDGSCGLCQRTVAVLRRLDVLDRIVFLDALGDWSRIREAFPSLREEDCLATMHVVTAAGQIETGFDAYRALSWSLPLLWPIAPLLYFPGVPSIGRRVYAAVAARRHRSGCPVPAGSTTIP